ncbi:MAG: hypothetical protein ACREMQ_14355 [Longimicrobiales bacterium]
MAVFLKENQIGFDAATVGFPGLGSCMGVVLQTNHGLFGFHAFGNNNNKGSTFGDYCRKHTQYGPALHLYGSSRWANRYDGLGNMFVAWLEEMKFVAGQLNYHGSVSGFDLSNKSSGVPTVGGESAYLQYMLASLSGAVTIRYAESEKVDYQEGIDATTTVRVIKPDQTIDAPHNNKVMQSVTPKVGSSNLSTVGDDGFYTVVL